MTYANGEFKNKKYAQTIIMKFEKIALANGKISIFGKMIYLCL
jgi:hypothetical protein